MQRAWRCPSRLLPLVDLPQKHRDAQPFARGLARQELALALWQMPPLAVMLGMGVCEEAGSQEHGMLAIFLTEDVSEVLVCYALRVYESPSTLQPNRVTS